LTKALILFRSTKTEKKGKGKDVKPVGRGEKNSSSKNGQCVEDEGKKCGSQVWECSLYLECKGEEAVRVGKKMRFGPPKRLSIGGRIPHINTRQEKEEK